MEDSDSDEPMLTPPSMEEDEEESSGSNSRTTRTSPRRRQPTRRLQEQLNQDASPDRSTQRQSRARASSISVSPARRPAGRPSRSTQARSLSRSPGQPRRTANSPGIQLFGEVRAARNEEPGFRIAGDRIRESPGPRPAFRIPTEGPLAPSNMRRAGSRGPEGRSVRFQDELQATVETESEGESSNAADDDRGGDSDTLMRPARGARGAGDRIRSRRPQPPNRLQTETNSQPLYTVDMIKKIHEGMRRGDMDAITNSGRYTFENLQKEMEQEQAAKAKEEANKGAGKGRRFSFGVQDPELQEAMRKSVRDTAGKDSGLTINPLATAAATAKPDTFISPPSPHDIVRSRNSIFGPDPPPPEAHLDEWLATTIPGADPQTRPLTFKEQATKYGWAEDNLMILRAMQAGPIPEKHHSWWASTAVHSPLPNGVFSPPYLPALFARLELPGFALEKFRSANCSYFNHARGAPTLNQLKRHAWGLINMIKILSVPRPGQDLLDNDALDFLSCSDAQEFVDRPGKADNVQLLITKNRIPHQNLTGRGHGFGEEDPATRRPPPAGAGGPCVLDAAEGGTLKDYVVHANRALERIQKITAGAGGILSLIDMRSRDAPRTALGSLLCFLGSTLENLATHKKEVLALRTVMGQEASLPRQTGLPVSLGEAGTPLVYSQDRYVLSGLSEGLYKMLNERLARREQMFDEKGWLDGLDRWVNTTLEKAGDDMREKIRNHSGARTIVSAVDVQCRLFRIKGSNTIFIVPGVDILGAVNQKAKEEMDKPALEVKLPVDGRLEVLAKQNEMLLMQNKEYKKYSSSAVAMAQAGAIKDMEKKWMEGKRIELEREVREEFKDELYDLRRWQKNAEEILVQQGYERQLMLHGEFVKPEDRAMRDEMKRKNLQVNTKVPFRMLYVDAKGEIIKDPKNVAADELRQQRLEDPTHGLSQAQKDKYHKDQEAKEAGYRKPAKKAGFWSKAREALATQDAVWADEDAKKAEWDRVKEQERRHLQAAAELPENVYDDAWLLAATDQRFSLVGLDKPWLEVSDPDDRLAVLRALFWAERQAELQARKERHAFAQQLESGPNQASRRKAKAKQDERRRQARELVRPNVVRAAHEHLSLEDCLSRDLPYNAQLYAPMEFPKPPYDPSVIDVRGEVYDPELWRPLWIEEWNRYGLHCEALRGDLRAYEELAAQMRPFVLPALDLGGGAGGAGGVDPLVTLARVYTDWEREKEAFERAKEGGAMLSGWSGWEVDGGERGWVLWTLVRREELMKRAVAEEEERARMGPNPPQAGAEGQIPASRPLLGAPAPTSQFGREQGGLYD